MNETRLLAASPPTLELVRGYLFNQVGLTELFDGNGYVSVPFRRCGCHVVIVHMLVAVCGWYALVHVRVRLAQLHERP